MTAPALGFDHGDDRYLAELAGFVAALPAA